MSQLLIQDLYQVNPGGTVDQPVNTPNPFQVPSFMTLDISKVVLNISIFVLIWNLFISFFYIADFFYYYKVESEDNFEIEKKATSRLYLAIRIWLTTLPSLVMITLAIFLPSNELVFFSLAILFYLFKIIYDLRLFAKISEYFRWYKDIFTNLRKLRLR